MSAIVNDRDILLQATVPRSTASIDKALLLSTTTPVFHVNGAGAGTPSSITIHAILLGMTGTVSFTVAGGSTIGVSGNTATLAFADMAAGTETVNASFVDDGVTYLAAAVISKVVDGPPGSTAPRAPVQLAASGYSAWLDSAAEAVLVAAGYGTPINRDVVTLYDATHSTTKFFDTTGGWLSLDAYIAGNLLVTGTVSADKLVAGSITAASGLIAALAVNTLQIAGNAVTVSQVVSGSSTITGTGSDITLLTATVVVPYDGYYLANFACRQGSNSGPEQWQMWLKFDGSTVFTTGGGTGGVGYAFTDSVAMAGAAFLTAGSHTVTVVWKGHSSMIIQSRTLSVVSAMR